MSKKHDALRYNITGFIGNIVFDKDLTQKIMSEGTYVALRIFNKIMKFKELIEMLIDEINSVPASEITPEHEKIQSFTNGLEVLSTILAHEDLKLPNITNGRKKLEKTICFLIELLPENMYSGVSYRSFKKERELIQNGTRAIKTFFCWRFSQLTHPIKDLPPGISHTPEKVNNLFAYRAKFIKVLQAIYRRRN